MTKTRKQPAPDPVATTTSSDDLRGPPAGVCDLAARWWGEIQTTFDIRDTEGLLVLHALIRNLDRAEQCAALIREQGEIVVGRDGQAKAHPLLTVERDARAGFLAALKKLDIAQAEPPKPGRPAGPGR